MTLLERIKRELGPGAITEATVWNDRDAIRVRLPGAGSFEATIYTDAATVQIRHLGAYQDARRAAKDLRAVLKGRPEIVGLRGEILSALAVNSRGWRRARAKLIHFESLAGRRIEGDPR